MHTDRKPPESGAHAGRSSAAMTPRLRFGVSIALTAIVAASVWLRIQKIDTVSYWFDESSSWKTIQYGWSEMWTPIERNVHPPVYYLLLKTWAIPFGDSPVSLRLFSVVMGIATVVGSYFFVLQALTTDCDNGDNTNGRRGSHLPSATDVPPAQRDKTHAADVANAPGANPIRDSSDSGQTSRHVTALFAAAMVGLSAMQVNRGVQARMYTLGTLLAILCALFALQVTRDGGKLRTWIGVTVSALLLSLTHYYGLFTVAAIYLFLGGVCIAGLVRRVSRSSASRLLIHTVISAWVTLNIWAFWLPYFLAQRAQVSRTYWSGAFEWPDVLHLVASLLTIQGGGRHFAQWNWLAINVWLTVCVVVAIVARRAGRLTALAMIVPLIASISYSLVARNIFFYRYLTFAQLFFLIGWALLTHRVRWASVRVIIMLGSLGWLGYWTSQHYDRRAMQSRYAGLRESAATLDEWRNPGDLVFVASAMVHPTMQRYTFQPKDIVVVDYGHPYNHFQGGPILRDSEYYSLDRLDDDGVDRVFTVDVYDMFRVGSRVEVRLPAEWEVFRQQEFEERFGVRMRLIVREYWRREQDAPADALESAVALRRSPD